MEASSLLTCRKAAVACSLLQAFAYPGLRTARIDADGSHETGMELKNILLAGIDTVEAEALSASEVDEAWMVCTCRQSTEIKLA